MKKIIYILLILFIIGCNSGIQKTSIESSVDTTNTNVTTFNGKKSNLEISKIVPDIEKVSKNLTGRLNYIMSDTMEVGITDIVSVVVSRNMTKDVVVNSVLTFRNRSRIVDTIIRVTPEMSVRLLEIGTIGNFHIDDLTSVVQKIEIEDTTLTMWQWRVTPLKDGDKVLTITVDLMIDGVEKNLNIYDGEIYVHMKNKFWVTIEKFLVDYWQWICSVILIPLVIWTFKTYILQKFKK